MNKVTVSVQCCECKQVFAFEEVFEGSTLGIPKITMKQFAILPDEVHSFRAFACDPCVERVADRWGVKGRLEEYTRPSRRTLR